MEVQSVANTCLEWSLSVTLHLTKPVSLNRILAFRVV